ncbi:hypothetical protein [Bergeyella zoohelcum]|uniref:hypothetical protein n=1 Tax=Bergeyella zoohelcum TaxID=1015 RepID=UPI0037360618
MAIFGAGSKWEDDEMKYDFFQNENYIIGWNIVDANDLYYLINSIKIGDIIYLKSNRPGSKDITVKGVGVVKDSLLNVLFDREINLSKSNSDFELPVKWIVKDEFKITIPDTIGKLTNIRAATLYEEYLPFVMKEILNKLLDKV